MATLLRIRYPQHIVSVLAVCIEPERRAIVMELMPLGSLYTLLHDRSNTSLSWSIRVRLALHAAKAIAHLHALDPPILHRDIKSPNYLVTESIENGERVYSAAISACRKPSPSPQPTPNDVGASASAAE